MSVPPTPFPTPGQPPNWGQQLIDAIVDRLGLTNDEVDALRVLVDSGRLSPAALAAAFADKGAVDALQDLTATGRLSEAELKSTIDTRVSDGLGDLDGADTGTAGLAVLAANLPEEARDALGITVDTSVGTRVFMGGVMVYGDTGWRDIRSILLPEWSADTSGLHYLWLRRVGDLCYLRGWIKNVSETPSNNILNLPAGFRTHQHGSLGTSQRDSASGGIASIASSSRLNVYPIVPADQTVMVQAVYMAREVWPTSLPGTPA